MKKVSTKVIILVALALLVYEGTKVLLWLIDNKIPNFEGTAELFVYPEMSVDEVLVQIDTQLVIKHQASLERTFKKKQVAEYMQPGHYVIEDGATSVYVARMLNNCWQTPVNLVLSGTLRKKNEIARKIAGQMMVDSASVIAAMRDQKFLSKYGFDTVNVFSLLMPDTYQMYWTATVEEIFDRQKEAYDAFWTEDRLKKAKAQGLTQKEVSILASIVKGETNYEPEMPKIAGVYLNRLRKGMKLQADPTIAFCYDYNVNRIYRRNLSYDSPYNTYKYAGLPPGPIYVPTKACLDAVLNPEGGKNLYFCADPSFNGSHRFAATYSEHLKNARAFQRALDQRKNAK